jgi:hypothetical protein
VLPALQEPPAPQAQQELPEEQELLVLKAVKARLGLRELQEPPAQASVIYSARD